MHLGADSSASTAENKELFTENLSAQLVVRIDHIFPVKPTSWEDFIIVKSSFTGSLFRLTSSPPILAAAIDTHDHQCTNLYPRLPDGMKSYL